MITNGDIFFAIVGFFFGVMIMAWLFHEMTKVGNKTNESMKTISEIITELQAVDTTALDAVVAAVNQAVTDLQAMQIGSTTTTTTTAPTATTVVISFSDGSSQTVPNPTVPGTSA